jgi:hypothetical protein
MVWRLFISWASPLWLRRSLKLANSGYCARILVMLKAVEVEIKHKNAMKRREEALESIFAKKMKPKPSLLLSLPLCLNSKLIMQRPLYACRDVDQK